MLMPYSWYIYSMCNIRTISKRMYDIAYPQHTQRMCLAYSHSIFSAFLQHIYSKFNLNRAYLRQHIHRISMASYTIHACKNRFISHLRHTHSIFMAHRGGARSILIPCGGGSYCILIVAYSYYVCSVFIANCGAPSAYL